MRLADVGTQSAAALTLLPTEQERGMMIIYPLRRSGELIATYVTTVIGELKC